jgi:hypothetical protein
MVIGVRNWGRLQEEHRSYIWLGHLRMTTGKFRGVQWLWELLKAEGGSEKCL